MFAVVKQLETITEAAEKQLSCRHDKARNIFLESVIFKDLPRQMFPQLSVQTDWFLDDIGTVEAFKCKKNHSGKRVYGYKSDDLSCGEHGRFVSFTRPTTPLIGMKLYINIFCGTTYIRLSLKCFVKIPKNNSQGVQ